MKYLYICGNSIFLGFSFFFLFFSMLMPADFGAGIFFLLLFCFL